MLSYDMASFPSNLLTGPWISHGCSTPFDSPLQRRLVESASSSPNPPFATSPNPPLQRRLAKYPLQRRRIPLCNVAESPLCNVAAPRMYTSLPPHDASSASRDAATGNDASVGSPANTPSRKGTSSSPRAPADDVALLAPGHADTSLHAPIAPAQF
jgi:hypothetical protein